MQPRVPSIRSLPCALGKNKFDTGGFPWQPRNTPSWTLSKSQSHCLFTGMFSLRFGEVCETRDCEWHTVVSLLEPGKGGPGGSWVREETSVFISFKKSSCCC